MSYYLRVNLLVKILISLCVGIVVGIALGMVSNGQASPTATETFVQYFGILGDIFIRLLKMIVVPVVLLSLIGGAASADPSRLGRVGLKLLFFYMATSVVAICIGLGLANLVHPGMGFHIPGDSAVEVALREAPPLSKVFLNIIPTNPIESLAKGDILPIIFFAILFGIALSILRASTNPKVSNPANMLYDVCMAGAEAMYKIVAGIMQYAPIGVFVLIATVFAQQGPRAIGPLLMVTATVFVGQALHLLVAYGACLGIYGLGLGTFVRKASQAMITAFVTRSSAGTLPISLRVAEERIGVPRSIASFSLPLGATINMDGTAIYLGVCSMFIGYATDMPLTFDQQLTVVITATLASIGTAGIPGAGAIMLLMVMDSIGLSVQPGTNIAAAYAMILGIDALLDMGRTGLNVTGDLVGATVVAKSEKVLDMGIWKNRQADA